MTAQYAEGFGRDVLAVPGSVRNANTYGPHMLIRSGAALVSSAEEVLLELGFNVPRRSKSSRPSLAELWKTASLDPLSRAILEVLSREDTPVDALIEKVRTSARELNEKLSFLEIEGFIKIQGVMARII